MAGDLEEVDRGRSGIEMHPIASELERGLPRTGADLEARGGSTDVRADERLGQKQAALSLTGAGLEQERAGLHVVDEHTDPLEDDAALVDDAKDLRVAQDPQRGSQGRRHRTSWDARAARR